MRSCFHPARSKTASTNSASRCAIDSASDASPEELSQRRGHLDDRARLLRPEHRSSRPNASPPCGNGCDLRSSATSVSATPSLRVKRTRSTPVPTSDQSRPNQRVARSRVSRRARQSPQASARSAALLEAEPRAFPELRKVSPCCAAGGPGRDRGGRRFPDGWREAPGTRTLESARARTELPSFLAAFDHAMKSSQRKVRRLLRGRR